MSIKIINLKMPGSLLSKIKDLGDKIILYSPVEVVLRSKEDGDFFVSFVPFLHFTEEYDKGITIDKSEVLNILTPKAEILEHYKNCLKNE